MVFAVGDFDLTNLFTDATTILQSLVTMATDFITTLWANPVGKITIAVGVISLAIGLAYSLVRVRRRKLG